MLKRVFAISIISLLLLASFVLGAGSSTGQRVLVCGDGTCEPGEVCGLCVEDCGTCPPGVHSASVATNITTTTCEDKATLRERIKCRFENKAVAAREVVNATEEACRGHANATRSACENLYRRSARCYDEAAPIARKACFLNESGINFNAGGTFRAAPQESKRNYVVLLLYELQERIEESQEDGKITTESAASLIEKIVEIKRMTLAKEPRASIIVKINEFRQEYRTVMSGVEQ